MENFITVATFNFPHEIMILRHRLEQEGITFFFQNETTATVAPMYSIALGGIKLKIHPNDLDVVKKILDELNDAHLKIV
ncbi:MAG TPA: DUF2007 domain-containing protein [Flavobacterium sp.]|nr:DUF2007 domain-containing protein [Flavobacterium sp.]